MIADFVCDLEYLIDFMERKDNVLLVWRFAKKCDEKNKLNKWKCVKLINLEGEILLPDKSSSEYISNEHSKIQIQKNQ